MFDHCWCPHRLALNFLLKQILDHRDQSAMSRCYISSLYMDHITYLLQMLWVKRMVHLRTCLRQEKYDLVRWMASRCRSLVEMPFAAIESLLLLHLCFQHIVHMLFLTALACTRLENSSLLPFLFIGDHQVDRNFHSQSLCLNLRFYHL